MPRIYHKKPEARTARITIPVSQTLLSRIRSYASSIGLLPTTAAHDLLKRSVEDATREGPK